MNILFAETPQLFGKVHLLLMAVMIIMNVILISYFIKKKEAVLLRFLHVSGLIMMILEVWKQFFCYYYVFDQTINLWFFPWQLCSMAMYCSFSVKYLDEKKQNCVLVFLATFSLLTDIVALALPLDMLRDQVLLTVHSFLYHGLIISQSVIAMMILKSRDYHFYPAVFLFLIMALIAEIINIISHAILNDIHREPDMFYITLSYPTTQPVFHDIAVKYGIVTEIVIYLATIILGSYLLYLMEKKLLKNNLQ